jgi:predicted secreted protein
MSILEVIIFFLVVWWPVFFIILPIGYQQLPQKNQIKFARSAPKSPNILIKFSITTIFEVLVTIIFWTLSFFNIFTLKNLFL